MSLYPYESPLLRWAFASLLPWVFGVLLGLSFGLPAGHYVTRSDDCRAVCEPAAFQLSMPLGRDSCHCVTLHRPAEEPTP